MSSHEPSSAETPVEPLTRREREILGLLAEGLSGPEIAEQLTLAISTVKSHIENAYSKLGASSKREALTRAQALGTRLRFAGAAFWASTLRWPERVLDFAR